MHWLAYTVVMDSFLNIRFISFSSRKLNYWNSSLTRTFPLGKMCVCFSNFPPLQHLLLRKNFRKQIAKKTGKATWRKEKPRCSPVPASSFLPFFLSTLITNSEKKTWVRLGSSNRSELITWFVSAIPKNKEERAEIIFPGILEQVIKHLDTTNIVKSRKNSRQTHRNSRAQPDASVSREKASN